MQSQNKKLKMSISQYEFRPQIDDALIEQVENRIDAKCDEFIEYLNSVAGEDIDDFDKESIKKHFSIDLLLRMNLIRLNRKNNMEEDVLSKGLYSLEAIASSLRRPLVVKSEYSLNIPDTLASGEYVFKDVVDLPSTKAFIDYLKKSPNVTLPSYVSNYNIKNSGKIQKSKKPKMGTTK